MKPASVKAGIKPKVVEHKTGKIYNTQDIQWEISRDEILVKEKGWLINGCLRVLPVAL
ncbi:MAG: hypothetical protein JWP81_1802 [Ferruginibacter sp.]|nr:hypothetical protein [Ferruginibacter sp.]